MNIRKMDRDIIFPIVCQGLAIILLYIKRFPFKPVLINYIFFIISFSLAMAYNIFSMKNKRLRKRVLLVEIIYVLILILSQRIITANYNKYLGSILGLIIIASYILYIIPKMNREMP